MEKLDKETSRKRSQGYVPISAFRKREGGREGGWWIHPFTDYAGTDSLFPRRRCSMIRRMALQPPTCHPSTASTTSAKLNCVCQIRSGKSFLDITGFRNRHQAMSSDPAGFRFGLLVLRISITSLPAPDPAVRSFAIGITVDRSRGFEGHRDFFVRTFLMLVSACRTRFCLLFIFLKKSP